MLDMKFVRENVDKVVQAMKNRNMDRNLDDFVELEKRRRELLQVVEADKSERNSASQEISKMKKAGKTPTRKLLPCVLWAIKLPLMTKN